MTRSNGFLRSLQNLCCWMLLGIGLLSGCKTLTVDSVPPGADVIIDGGVSGFKTPWRFDARSFGTGTHTISVSMRDFKSLTPEYKIEAFVSGGKIAGAILLPVPCLFVGMRTGFKSLRATNMTFILEQLTKDPGLAAEVRPTVPAKER